MTDKEIQENAGKTVSWVTRSDDKPAVPTVKLVTIPNPPRIYGNHVKIAGADGETIGAARKDLLFKNKTDADAFIKSNG